MLRYPPGLGLEGPFTRHEADWLTFLFPPWRPVLRIVAGRIMNTIETSAETIQPRPQELFNLYRRSESADEY